ncbi:MAG: RagB/SusD family nutrient uptake outer membrane protein [Bacteroidaceae bacterium]|nr:RagB/SusD family nutrient uptake outer membrane protein [Bacteroidaceae bacterium]
MKKIMKYTAIALFAIGSLTACSSDKLETAPTDAVSGSTLMGNSNTAIVALNGIYRTFYTMGANQETFGPTSWNLVWDCMAEDMVMGAGGNGWFEWDVLYRFKNYWTSSGERCYNLWNDNYTWISNANYILAADSTMTGDDVDYVIGQAYAIRAFSYFNLAQAYARTLVGHENEPCVPIYTEPTVPGTQGKPRVSVKEVYAQIDADINKAIDYLEKTNNKQDDKTHISYAVALGLKARIALVENKWQEASEAATAAIAASGCEIQDVEDFLGCNDVSCDNVMWGAYIKADQATGYASFFAHMDPGYAYGKDCYKMINRTLYDSMNETDSRRDWWDVDMNNDGTLGYQHVKFLFKNPQDWTGDYIWMRVEEMYLIAAEAECRLGHEAEAKEYLSLLMDQRDPNYDCSALTGTALGTTSNEETGSLLEEIIRQRRIELWGEIGRLNDLKRLHQGFRRTEEQGWPSQYLLSSVLTDDPESFAWIFLIPQAEFDGNVNMDIVKDQNPLGDKQ